MAALVVFDIPPDKASNSGKESINMRIRYSVQFSTAEPVA